MIDFSYTTKSIKIEDVLHEGKSCRCKGSNTLQGASLWQKNRLRLGYNLWRKNGVADGAVDGVHHQGLG